MGPDRSFWQGCRVCVTGGAGFLGYHLVTQLQALGARVRVLTLPPGAAHPLHRQSRIKCHFGDILDLEKVYKALDGCDVVFHTAGPVATWGPALEKMYEVHREGTRNVLEAAPRATRIVHTSSIVTVGAARRPRVMREEDPFTLGGLRVDYVRAKRQAEEVALAGARDGRDIVVVNPGYLVGPGDHERSVMGRRCVRFWRGQILAAPGGGLNVVDVRDVARGHLLAAERGAPGTRYILGGENHSSGDFLRLLARAAGMEPRGLPRLPGWVLGLVARACEARARSRGKEPCPSVQDGRMNRYYWYASSERAARQLGYTFRPVAESLKDAYRWHQAAWGLAPLRGLNRWWFRAVPVPAGSGGQGQGRGLVAAEEVGLAREAGA